MGKDLRGSCPHVEPLKACRAQAVDWVVRLHGNYLLRKSTLFLAVLLIDRYLGCLQARPISAQLKLKRHRLLAAAALSLASKFEDEAVPEFASLVQWSKGEFGLADLHEMELVVLSKLNFRLHLPMAPHHLHWFLEVMGASQQQRLVAEYVCAVGLESPELPRWSPADHAAAAVVLSSMLQGIPEWPPTFEACCGVTGSDSKRTAIMQALFGLCRALAWTGPGHAVYDKHCSGGLAPMIEAIVRKVIGKKE